MSLLDALLNEGYRDSRDIYIALRNDGSSCGSGTIADPYDGGSRLSAGLTVTGLAPDSLDALEAVVTTSANHNYSDGDVVNISGVTGSGSSAWNGTFPIYSASGNTFRYYMAAPPSAAPGGGDIILSAKVIFRFDDVMRAAPANSRIHIGPGVFETRGYAGGSPHDWQAKSGQSIVGSGMGVTTLRIVQAALRDKLYLAIGADPPTEFPGGIAPVSYMDGFEARDFTIDCNLGGQPVPKGYDFAPLACGGIAPAGRHIRIERVRVIHYGTQSAAVECFVIFPAGANANMDEAGWPAINCLIEDCIAEHPWDNNVYTISVFGMSGTEFLNTGGKAGYHRACAMRNNYCNGDFNYGPVVKVDNITYSGAGTPTVWTAVLTTQTPHLRAVGDTLIIRGALVSGSADNQYNGAFLVDEVVSGSVLKFKLYADPGAAPTGEITIGGDVPSILVPIDASQSSLNGSATMTLATTRPHYRTTRNNVAVQNLRKDGDPTDPGVNASFKVTKALSPKKLECKLKSGGPQISDQ